jgi:hypothetical protein
MPEARVFRRAGRGKSASPVRGGESGSGSPSPSLLLYWLRKSHSCYQQLTEPRLKGAVLKNPGDEVHIVVEADAHPERIMNDLKSYASRCLNQLGLEEPRRKRWARHGSTRWLWKPQSVSAAIRYVVDEQGEPMAVFEAIEN